MIRLNNLGTRVIVALFGIPLIVIVCILGKWLFLLFTLFVGLISFFELSKMVTKKHHHTNKFIGSLSVAALIFNAYFKFIDFQSLALIIVLLLLLFELSRSRESAVSNLGSSLIGIFYIGMFSASFISLREFYSESHFMYSNGGYLIISVFATIWLCDSAAYFIGSAIGNHKIFPRISPNKSWEGSIAGFVFSIIGMTAARYLVLEFLSVTDAVAIGIIVGIFGQAGDFAESMIKRDVNVKDSSSIIPGHGGIFDRFDSLLFSIPLVYLYLVFFAK